MLKSIIDIFLFLENAKTYKRKPKYQYKSFYIEYSLNNDDYAVYRETGTKIDAYKNGEKINYKDVKLPAKVLALSFMVNDKFPFRKDDESDMYVYHGVRPSTNSTFTSSITRNITFDLINSIKRNYHKQISDIFSILGFEPTVEFEWEKGSETIRIDLKKYDPVSFDNYNESYFPAVYFIKNKKRISFDSCSSGEKHLLFAYIGILSRIKEGSLILIDGPEISLHPEWQIRYISTLNKLFGEYKNCCFMIASHSHYFVSELKATSSSIVIFRKNSNDDNYMPEAELLPFDTYSWSAENIIYNVFGIRTTRNYYFECDLNNLINSINNYDDSDEQKIEIQRQICKLKKFTILTILSVCF